MAFETWADVTYADDYLEFTINSSAWFVTGLDKELYLTQAYRRIKYDPNLTIPSSPDSTQLDLLKRAQSELALFYVNSGDAQSERESLVNQGVKKFKIGQWEEEFRDEKSDTTDINRSYPPIVAGYLESFERVILVAPRIRKHDRRL